MELSLNIYQKFQTDSKKETEGTICRVYGSQFEIARAGGSNHKFRQLFQERAADKLEIISDDEGQRLLIEIFVDSCLINWSKVEDKNGPLEYSRENAIRLMTDLPELFNKLYNFSQELNNFLEYEEKK